LVIILLASIGAYALYKYLGQKGIVEESGKWCQGVKIVSFAGGNMQDPFSLTLYHGAEAAQKDLGPSVEYVWSDWNSDTMALQFEKAINESPAPDAISMMGHAGEKVLSSFINEAESKNIIVTLANVDLQNIRAEYQNNGFGYVGQGLYASGLLVSEGIIREYNLGEGMEAIVLGVDPTTDPARYQRTQGIIDGLEKGGLIVHQIIIPQAVQTDTNSTAAQKLFADVLNKYPNSKALLIDHGALTASSPALLKNLGKKPGDIIVGGFDLSTSTVSGIESGYIGLVQDQQPYLQGYLPILQACLTKKYGFAGLYIDTGIGLIDKSNIHTVAKLVDKGIR
jgi:simple sugar transport system substrate-binding protein